MIVQNVTVYDVMETNAYFYIDEKTHHGFLIDAGAEPQKLIDIIKKEGWTIEVVLLTHGHFDHIGAAEEVCRALNVPYKIHRAGEEFLKDPALNLSAFFWQKMVLENAQYFDEGDEISLSANPSVKLKVIHTPGHTPDSVVFYDEKNKTAFVGDTIFRAGVGNTSFPKGDEKTLWQSIKNKIFTLDDDVTLYTGHSSATTVGREKQRYGF